MNVRAIAPLIVAAWLAGPRVCAAGGTVDLADVDPLLRQSPAVQAFLASSLDLHRTVMAAVRFGAHVKHLGGARMGPYMIQARPKGAGGAYTIEVVLCTHPRFVDAAGNDVASEIDAMRVEERVTAVLLRDAHSAPAIPACP